MNPKWVSDLRDQCQCAGVPFFFKQWGGRHKKRAGRLLEGRLWDEMPLAAVDSSERCPDPRLPGSGPTTFARRASS
jgi:hypothetical protein